MIAQHPWHGACCALCTGWCAAPVCPLCYVQKDPSSTALLTHLWPEKCIHTEVDQTMERTIQCACHHQWGSAPLIFTRAVPQFTGRWHKWPNLHHMSSWEPMISHQMVSVSLIWQLGHVRKEVDIHVLNPCHEPSLSQTFPHRCDLQVPLSLEPDREHLYSLI